MKKISQLSLSAWIFIGLVLGAASGVFLGDLVRPLEYVGKAFIRLLQMGVLPYMVVTLIHGIGGISAHDARLIATKGSSLLVLFWAVGLVVIFAFALAFPVVQTSSFFSVPEIAASKKMDFLTIYIPTNIFSALNEASVPAIVFFSVFLGVALLGIEDKQPLLKILSVLSKALSRMTNLVIKTAPIGVFALAASAAGTLAFEQIQRLQVYFVCYILVSLVLTFWLLPVLVSCFTGFSLRDILSHCKEALLLGFATGNNFVILPIIAERSKELLAKTESDEDKRGRMVDSVLPLAYSFPSLGKIIELLFIVFVAWFVNQSISLGQYFELGFAGVMSLFGSPKIGIPFLLSYMKLPTVYFDLYLMADVVTRKFKVLLQTMSMQALTLLIVFLILHKPVISIRKVVTGIVGTVIIVGASIFAAKVGLSYSVGNFYSEDIVLMSMEIKDPAPYKIVNVPVQEFAALAQKDEPDTPLFQRIKKRGSLRVGFDPEALPFAFYNLRQELVGYDIALAHRLAKDLGVSLEFVPMNRVTMLEFMNEGAWDILMSGVPVTADDLQVMNFSRPYMDAKGALVVEDYRKTEFQKISTIAAMPKPRIAVTPANSPEELVLLKHRIPNVELVELASIRDFFLKKESADALLTNDKIGKAWALLYPEFGVAVPEPLLFVYDLAYPIPVTSGDQFFLEYVNHWLTIQKTSGVSAELFSYWILGQTPQRFKPRWSVVRNVLHWVN